ncbi:uncharacterized protein LAESUDRAFT_640316 [Laetiporus sulphureus 93-53]|uniref:Cyclin N-terminal domain-containing protein n=1 Tax=Laetiporus sulphureus 93-53 TaxID=1314785 RepID=A0A165I3C1_9APHY|nr:uncharacterized protein LAESUDRAFT_640316 [Laetiporus sulphureus 93-53]KZT12540.1 hypothetical protein LAESUDRAFT_640316 [Laetiporus sulphureus 93-53]
MPVPVSLCSKQPAHPVIKINQSVQPSQQPSVFQHLTHTLPRPPRGPPPAFASREEWISSLPSWRRNKPRRIWEEDPSHYYNSGRQGFEEGLAVAGNATVIKGTPAQACIPPVSPLIAGATGRPPSSPSADMHTARDGDIDYGMSIYSAREYSWQCDDRSQTSNVSPITNAEYDDMDVERSSEKAMSYQGYDTDTPDSFCRDESSAAYSAGLYEHGTFSPVLDDMSPEPINPGFSPIGPATPFADYVDKAVAAQYHPAFEFAHPIDVTRDVSYMYTDEGCSGHCHQCQTYGPVMEALPAPAPEPVVTPTATAAYKKLAEPLSAWLASYVWKVCTTGMSLPSAYAQPRAFVKHYSSTPPSHLASATHSMLLSTLLQPSAIFLATRFIIRLPVFFGPVNLNREEHAKEIRFRNELLGEPHMSHDRDAIESYAPFRLILLGCMLANKWLDDHTFSNKTWHTISNVPVQSLNKLEALALDIFRYNLSISVQDWNDWLSKLLAYHSSLNSLTCPQPISRPSTSPHTIIRKAIEMLHEVRMVSPTCRCCDEETCSTAPPEPIFVNLEDRKKDTQEAARPYEETVDVLEIDLDEDGPLREEYLPRRRVSSASTSRHTELRNRAVESGRLLPPPAKWSPAADEPIVRDHARAPRQYLAPQPVAHMPVPHAFLAAPPTFHQVVDSHHPAWQYGPYVPKQEHIAMQEHAVPAQMYHVQPPYVAYEYGYPAIQTHSRSQSLSYNQAVAEQAQGRHPAYSQIGYDHAYSDVRFSEDHMGAVPPHPVISRWAPADLYPALYDRPFDYYQRPLKV